ncbi:DNA repair protein RecO, partial [Francisella tularensis subsp. holarctica]|nr:DNA repair protein RecO [Francisella tularensis subsp. holarctica]
IDGMLIQTDCKYIIHPNGFRKDFSFAGNSISGSSLKKINQPLSSGSNDDLKAISRVTRVCVYYVLAGKQLKSRKLLV